MNKELTLQQLKFYKGIKFVRGKSDLHQADCFGLVKLVNVREYNFPIEEYVRSESTLMAFKSIDKYFNNLITNDWVEVKEPYSGCTVVLSDINVKEKDYATHVGIYVKDNKILTSNLIMQFSNIIPIPEHYKVLGYY